MKISEISIKRSSLVVVVFVLLTSLGIFSYSKLNYELVPDMSIGVITVATIYPGASPTEVEYSVTKKVEDAVASLENIKKISSQSFENYSVVIIELIYGSDVKTALDDAQRKVDKILKDLPDDCESPSLSKFAMSDLPIMNIGVSANMPVTEFFDLIKNRVKPELSQTQGLAQVKMLGGDEREISVNIDAEKLEVYNLSISHVVQIINASNLDFPTGKVKSEAGQTLIRLAGKLKDAEELKNLVIINSSNGAPVKLKDIGEVVDSHKETEVLVRANGKNSIGLLLIKQSDANAVEVSKKTKDIISKLEAKHKDVDLKFNITKDTSIFTMDAADAVMHDLILAIILVALVMLLFLHSLRNAIIVMISIPASLIATFTIMYLAGFSLNLLTMLGLSLVVGILVDDAIVVIENIHSHLEKGKNAVNATYDAIKEIGATVTSITLVIVVVFVPIAMTTGVVSDMLRQFSITVAFATLMSLFVSFTLVGLLSSRFTKLEHFNKNSFAGKFIGVFEGYINKFQNWIVGIMKWSLNHKIITLVLTIALFFGSIALIPMGYIGAEFVDGGDNGEFFLEFELPKNATVEQTNMATRKAENYLFSLPEVENVFAIIGTTSKAQEGQTTAYKSEISVKLVDAKKRDFSSEVISQKVKVALEEKISGLKVKAAAGKLIGGGIDPQIKIVLQGADFNKLMEQAKTVIAEVEQVQGTTQVKTSVDDGNPEIKIEVNREKMASLGLNLGTVGMTLQTAFNGNDKAKLRVGAEEYDIKIRFDAFDRKNISDIQNVNFQNNKGQLIKLKQFANIFEGTGPSQLDRRDRMASVTVECFVLGRSVGTVGDEIKERVSKVQELKDVNILYEGELEKQSDAFGTLGFALLASIFLVYLIMIALYDSYVYPFVVLFSIPLAIIGALFALALTKQTLNIFSILGIIMLIGLVAKNAILVVDFTNQLKKEGLKVREALIKATQMRFRPILMTTLAMVIGMLPIALAIGPGAEWKNGLAWALIGGLISSMFLTLVVVPVVYYIFDRILAKFGLDKQKIIKINSVDK